MIKKLNKLHLFGLLLLVIITGSLLSGFVFSLGNKQEPIQSLNQGNQEFICKAVPKKPPSARDVEVGYYANSNNMKPQEQVHPGLLPVNNKEGFFGSMSRFFSSSIIEGIDASGNEVDASGSTVDPSGATTDAAGGAAGAANEAAKKLADCHKKWQNAPTALENYNKAVDAVKAQMETQYGCKPPVATSDPNTTTTAGASTTDGPQWKCIQVGQENNIINEERVDEKGVEGKMRGVPPGDEDLYMLKTKIVPPVCPKCPECPCAKCPVCEKDNNSTNDNNVEDDMEANKIKENGDSQTNQRLNNREPEQGQASRARANRVIKNLGNQSQSNGNFLQPPGGTNNAVNNLMGSGGSIAPRNSGGFNLGAFSRGLTGPLPRLNSFSSFA